MADSKYFTTLVCCFVLVCWYYINVDTLYHPNRVQCSASVTGHCRFVSWTFHFHAVKPRQVVYTWTSIAKQYNLVSASVWCCAVGKVSTGNALHMHKLSIQTNMVNGLGHEDEHHQHSSVQYSKFTFYLIPMIIFNAFLVLEDIYNFPDFSRICMNPVIIQHSQDYYTVTTNICSTVG